VRTPISAPRHGEAKVTADQLKNHRKTVANVRAMGASKISASRINVSLSYGRGRQRFMMGTSIRRKYTLLYFDCITHGLT